MEDYKNTSAAHTGTHHNGAAYQDNHYKRNRIIAVSIIAVLIFGSLVMFTDNRISGLFKADSTIMSLQQLNNTANNNDDSKEDSGSSNDSGLQTLVNTADTRSSADDNDNNNIATIMDAGIVGTVLDTANAPNINKADTSDNNDNSLPSLNNNMPKNNNTDYGSEKWCCVSSINKVLFTTATSCADQGGKIYSTSTAAQDACKSKPLTALPIDPTHNNPPATEIWCCNTNGNVTKVDSNRICMVTGGKTYSSKSAAEADPVCKPKPDPKVWCCDYATGKVTQDTATNCDYNSTKGVGIYQTQSAAQADPYCAPKKEPKPDPKQWCCIYSTGNVIQDTAANCDNNYPGGVGIYDTQAKAQADPYCKEPEKKPDPKVWCCIEESGQVFQTTSAECIKKGAVYSSQSEAQAACISDTPTPTPKTWCCVESTNSVSYGTTEECRDKGGEIYVSQSDAQTACTPQLPPPPAPTPPPPPAPSPPSPAPKAPPKSGPLVAWLAISAAGLSGAITFRKKKQ